MKANELMIGDWVMLTDPINNGEKVQVKEIHGDGYITVDGAITNMFEPIPLTAEILEKNGWRKIGRKTYMDKQMCVLANHYDDKWQMSYGGIDDYTNIPNIRYVHELQHALRLCNIDKEIEL